MGSLERAHQIRVINELEARKRELEIRAAREGYDTPAEVNTEIAQIDTNLARLRDAIDAPLSEQTVAALSPDDRYQGHVAWQMRMESTLYRFEKSLIGLLRAIYVMGSVLLVVTTVVIVLCYIVIRLAERL